MITISKFATCIHNIKYFTNSGIIFFNKKIHSHYNHQVKQLFQRAFRIAFCSWSKLGFSCSRISTFLGLWSPIIMIGGIFFPLIPYQVSSFFTKTALLTRTKLLLIRISRQFSRFDFISCSKYSKLSYTLQFSPIRSRLFWKNAKLEVRSVINSTTLLISLTIFLSEGSIRAVDFYCSLTCFMYCALQSPFVS